MAGPAPGRPKVPTASLPLISRFSSGALRIESGCGSAGEREDAGTDYDSDPHSDQAPNAQRLLQAMRGVIAGRD